MYAAKPYNRCFKSVGVKRYVISMQRFNIHITGNIPVTGNIDIGCALNLVSSLCSVGAYIYKTAAITVYGIINSNNAISICIKLIYVALCITAINIYFSYKITDSLTDVSACCNNAAYIYTSGIGSLSYCIVSVKAYITCVMNSFDNKSAIFGFFRRFVCSTFISIICICGYGCIRISGSCSCVAANSYITAKAEGKHINILRDCRFSIKACIFCCKDITCANINTGYHMVCFRTGINRSNAYCP